MGYQINGMEIEDYIEKLNTHHLRQTLFGMVFAFLGGMLIGIIIG